MPTYEYRCNACKREFEYQQRMVDDDKVTCEACGQDALEKLISRTAFSFKGGGWYKDLYASPKPEGGDKGGDKPAASSDAPATPATPATPAAPAATPAAPSTAASSGSPSPSSGSSGASSGGSSSGGASSGGSSGGSSGSSGSTSGSGGGSKT